MAECIEPSRVWTIIATATLNVRSQVFVNKIAVRLGPRCIHAPNIAIVRINGLESRSNAEALFFGYDRKDTFPTTVGSVRNGMISCVKLANILGA